MRTLLSHSASKQFNDSYMDLFMAYVGADC